MNLLPFESITYRTHLAPEYVLELIKRAIEPKKTFRIISIFGSDKYKDYEGKIDENGDFEISRIISYRNSFLPVIKGKIEQDISGSTITVKMRLHLVVMFFMMFWCGAVGIGFMVAMVFQSLGNEIQALNFIPLAMFFFGYGLTMGGFKYESNKSKKFLAKLFDTELEVN